MTQTSAHRSVGAGYRHEAFVWRGVDAFLARTVPFVAEAVEQGLPTMVALPEHHWSPLREALGTSAAPVRYVDMALLGGNPGRIIPAWLDFVAGCGADGRELRGIGEPIWAGRRSEEILESQLHEAMLNVAVPEHVPLWLLCPYEADALPADVAAEACRSHPLVDEGAGPSAPTVGSGYRGPEHSLDLWARALPAPVRVDAEQSFAPGGLAAVRRLVRAHGRAAGLAGDVLGDLVLAVDELAANSVHHGGGAGTVRVWRRPDALVVEVRDAGRVADLLVGRSSPTPVQPRGRGLWMVHQLCDLVQMRSCADGTVVRVLTWL